MQNNFLKFFLVVALFFTLTTAAFAESWISRVMGSLLPSGNSWSASVFNLTSGDLTQRNLSNITVQKTDTPSLTGTSILTNASKASASSISIIPVDKWKLKCLAINGMTPQPQIEVLSPNGGETFMAGQQITVNWRSCNVQNFPGTNTSAVSILLKQESTGVRYNLISNTHPQYGHGNYTQNDGSEVVTLPTISTYPVTPISYGTDFKIIVVLAAPYPPIETNNGAIYDESNSLFTINGGVTPPSSSTSTAPLLLKPLDASSAVGFGGNNGGSGSLSGSHLVSLKNTSNAPVWIACDAVGVIPEFVGNHNGFNNTLTCTTSLGHLADNLSNSLKLDPGQEMIFNRTVTYATPLSYSNLNVDFRTKITNVRYRLSQSSTTDIVMLPQDHPQFQSAWSALLASPWINY